MKPITKIIIAASISFLTYKAYGAYQNYVDPDHVEATFTAKKYGNEYQYNFPQDKHLQETDKQSIKNKIESDSDYSKADKCYFRIQYDRTRLNPEWNIDYTLPLPLPFTQIWFKFHSFNNNVKESIHSTCTLAKEGDQP